MFKLWIGKKKNILLKAGLLQLEHTLPGVISTGVDDYFQQVIPDRLKFYSETAVRTLLHCTR